MSYISRKAGGPGALGAVVQLLTPKPAVAAPVFRPLAPKPVFVAPARTTVSPGTGFGAGHLPGGLSLPGLAAPRLPRPVLDLGQTRPFVIKPPLRLSVLTAGKSAEAAAVNAGLVGDTTGGSITQGGGGAGGSYGGGGSSGGGAATTAPTELMDREAPAPGGAPAKGIPTVVIVAGVGLIAYALLKKKGKR